MNLYICAKYEKIIYTCMQHYHKQHDKAAFPCKAASLVEISFPRSCQGNCVQDKLHIYMHCIYVASHSTFNLQHSVINICTYFTFSCLFAFLNSQEEIVCSVGRLSSEGLHFVHQAKHKMHILETPQSLPPT